jgi:hypothetical protein
MRSICLAILMTCACAEDSGPGAADAGPVADATDAPTWTNFAAEFLDSYCGACHGAGDALRDYTVLAMVRAEAGKIRCGVSPTTLPACSIAAGMFPIGSGPKPTDEERLELVRWIDEGAIE